MQGYSLYVYCHNRPMLLIDERGLIVPAMLVGSLVGAATAVITKLTVNYLTGKSSSTSEYVNAAIGGAISGAFGGGSLIVTMFFSAAGNVAEDVLNHVHDGRPYSEGDVGSLVVTSLVSALTPAYTRELGPRVIRDLTREGTGQMSTREVTRQFIGAEIETIPTAITDAALEVSNDEMIAVSDLLQSSSLPADYSFPNKEFPSQTSGFPATNPLSTPTRNIGTIQEEYTEEITVIYCNQLIYTRRSISIKYTIFLNN